MAVDRIRKRLSGSEPFRQLLERAGAPFETLSLRGLPGSLTAFALSSLAESVQGPVLAVCADEERAESLRDDLERIQGTDNVGFFAAWDISPFDGRSPHLDVVGLRMEALDLLRRGRSLVVAPVSALIGYTLSKDLFALAVRDIKVGESLSPTDLSEHLVEVGFERVTTVEGLGQFSVRGGIVDFYSFGNGLPCRLEFWGDEVSSIRGFDVGTQRSVEEVSLARILPCREAILAGTMADEFALHLEQAEKALSIDLTILREMVAHQGAFDGVEGYLGLLYGKGATLFDHLPADCTLFVDEPVGIETAVEEEETRLRRAAERQKPRRGEPEPLPLSAVATTAQTCLASIRSHRRILNQSLGEKEGSLDFGGITGRRYEGHLQVLSDDLTKFWKDGYDLVLLCESQGQKSHLEEALSVGALPLSIEVGTLQQGFIYPAGRVVVVNDHEVYSRHRRQRRYRRFKEGSPIRSVSALHRGDFVVHVDHGIARYEGLQRLSVDGVTRDCLTLAYRDKDRVFVPVDQMDRVQKYSSQDGVVPVLSKLGTPTWERLKEKTRKEIFKMATELVALYAERKAKAGHAFATDGPLHHALAASFPYQETRDQMKAILDVTGDMEAESPMDRLVCGDVGYGKTEVAIRAAFKAVNDGKQVAILVPTTILAQQHYRTFSDRMAEFPVRVEVISRFRTRSDQQKVIDDVSERKVDILIGTHRLLSQDVAFNDLGLLVVDEEHRFGVKHKERLKQMRRLVDVLTLTATPIPRTLHMSLMGARDMSIIETPPKDRLPIHTEILPFAEDRIAEAILREIDRGGQVYFVHNRVQSIHAMAEFLERLVPNVRFGIGHGQMPERELEKVMLDFLERRTDCLVSTMIIESGLDIPTVNTLIVNRADRFGLAQLYQLRGRVGRSSQRAFAYLLIPSRKALRKPAVRRLRAIEEFSDLGSGFHISMRDMEIRGAGNILGAQQHGHIQAVGFDLYTRLLDEAVRQIKGEETGPSIDPDVQISVSAYLPDDYVPDADQKMQFYQRLGDARQTVQVLAIEEELKDRFGDLPDPASALLDTIHVKLLARHLSLSSLVVGPVMTLTYPEEASFTREDVEKMVSQSPVPLQFMLGSRARVEAILDGSGAWERLRLAKKVLMSFL